MHIYILRFLYIYSNMWIHVYKYMEYNTPDIEYIHRITPDSGLNRVSDPPGGPGAYPSLLSWKGDRGVMGIRKPAFRVSGLRHSMGEDRVRVIIIRGIEG
jgi:hypothetical protein